MTQLKRVVTAICTVLALAAVIGWFFVTILICLHAHWAYTALWLGVWSTVLAYGATYLPPAFGGHAGPPLMPSSVAVKKRTER